MRIYYIYDNEKTDLLIISCSYVFLFKEWWDRPITLTVGIDPDAYYEINSIVLPGNSFDTFISRGTSRTFTISEIPGGSMNVRVDFTLICDGNGLDYGFNRVMNFDTSKTVVVGKPFRAPDDSSPCGCNCYEVTVN